jgi:hypothetical protein
MAAPALEGKARREALEAEIRRLETALAKAEARLVTAGDEDEVAELHAADRRVLRWMLFAMVALCVVVALGLASVCAVNY